MAWANIDDAASYHPKARKAGLEAWGFYIAAIVYSNKLLKDGVVLVDALEDVWPWGDKKQLLKIAKRLEDAKYFDPIEGGWFIHDYFDHQKSREDVLAARAAESERKRIARGQPSSKRPPGVRLVSGRTDAGQTPDSERTPAGLQATSEIRPPLAQAPAGALPSHPLPIQPQEDFADVDAANFNRRDLERAVSAERGTDWRVPVAAFHVRQADETAAHIMAAAGKAGRDPHELARRAFRGWLESQKSVDPMAWCTNWSAALPPAPKPQRARAIL